MATLISKKLLPPKIVFDSLPIREQEQLPLIIGSNLVFMLMFTFFWNRPFYFWLPAGWWRSCFSAGFFWLFAGIYKAGTYSQRSLAHNNCNCHHYCT